MQNEKKQAKIACSSCIEQLRNLESGDVASPFDRQLILDFHDGTLTALLQCGTCGTAYLAKIIDWDSTFDKRIFALAPLSAGVFEEIVKLCSRDGQTPKWPMWLPHRLPNEPEHSETDAAIESLLKQVEPPCLVIAADRYIKRVWASRVPDAAVYDDILHSNTYGLEGAPQSVGIPEPTRDWFEYIDFRR